MLRRAVKGDGRSVGLVTILPLLQARHRRELRTEPHWSKEELVRHLNEDERMSEFDFALQFLDPVQMTHGGERREASYWVENAAVEWNEFERRVGSEHAAATLDHIDRSITASIDRSRSILGYAPRYSSLEALRESLRWLVEHGRADVAGQAF